MTSFLPSSLPALHRHLWLWMVLWAVILAGIMGLSRPLFTAQPASDAAAHSVLPMLSTALLIPTHHDASASQLVHLNQAPHADEHCQSNTADKDCSAPTQHSSDCLWQCLLLCMAHMLMFVLLWLCALKIRLLAYAALSLHFKSSSLKRRLKPPKALTVLA